MEGNSQRAAPQGSIIPIFCTADIAAEELDDFLERDATHQVWESFRVHIIDTTDDEKLAAIDTASTPPTASFASPFLGQNIIELNDFFLQHIRPLCKFTNSVFIVLDQFSEEDVSCDLVVARRPRKDRLSKDGAGQGGEEEEDSDEDEQVPDSLRCDYYAARQIATLVELGVQGLYDNRDPNVVHTIDTVPLDI